MRVAVLMSAVRGQRVRSCALSHMDHPASRVRLASFRAAISTVVAIVVLSDAALAFVAPIFHSSGSTSTTATTAGVDIMSSSSSSSATPTEQESARKERPSPPAVVKGVLFDMDGTLTDSDTLHFEAYRETFLKASTVAVFRIS